jgi:serine/threonine-protein kinase
LESTMEFEVGSLVDRRYLIKREIARGGTAAVFQAEHIFTKREVAIKCAITLGRQRQEGLERLLNEARALTLARHPNVAHALDAGETETGEPFLVVELLEGRTLAGILAVRPRLNSEHAAHIGRQLCGALGAAHYKNIWHRDLKPSNVFVARDEYAGELIKLFDFGISQMPELDRKVTQENVVLGTPEYMAPEQLLMSKDVDHRCDIYALGVTLYECLTGTVPFEGNFAEVLLGATSGRPIPASQRAPAVHPRLSAVIDRALAADPDKRFQTAQAFAQALEEALPAPYNVGSLLGIHTLAPHQPRSKQDGAVACEAEAMPAAAPVVPAPQQRRKFPRAPYITPVRVFRSDGTTVDGRSEDVSVGGLLVLIKHACHQEERVRVRFALPITGVVIQVSATARWMKLARGTEAMGLQFEDLPLEGHNLIERYVTLMGA